MSETARHLESIIGTDAFQALEAYLQERDRIALDRARKQFEAAGFGREGNLGRTIQRVMSEYISTKDGL